MRIAWYFAYQAPAPRSASSSAGVSSGNSLGNVIGATVDGASDVWAYARRAFTLSAQF